MSTERDYPAPPAGEDIHLPGPTLLPLFTAVGITLAVIGTTISIILVIVGLVILVTCVIRWIAETRRDIAALPLEHHAAGPPASDSR